MRNRWSGGAEERKLRNKGKKKDRNVVVVRCRTDKEDLQQFINASCEPLQITEFSKLYSNHPCPLQLNGTGHTARSLHKATEAYLHARSKLLYSR